MPTLLFLRQKLSSQVNGNQRAIPRANYGLPRNHPAVFRRVCMFRPLVLAIVSTSPGNSVSAWHSIAWLVVRDLCTTVVPGGLGGAASGSPRQRPEFRRSRAYAIRAEMVAGCG